MTKEELVKKLEGLENEAKITEVNYHRIQGAIAFTKNLIAEMDKPATPAVPV